MLQAIENTKFSIGYVGLGNVQSFQRSNDSINESYPKNSCEIKVAKFVSKDGSVVSASQATAQSALRSRSLPSLLSSACPGFGLCVDISNVNDSGVWPIVAVSVCVLQN